MKFGQTSARPEPEKRVLPAPCMAWSCVRLTCSALGHVHELNVRCVSCRQRLLYAARSSGVEEIGCSFGPLALSTLASDLTVSKHLSMALLALAALLGVQAEDTACLLQSHRAQVRTTTCPHGVETYDFSTWEAKLYSKDEGPPEGGILITSFEATSNCLKPGIFNSKNGDASDQDILDCNCNALVMAEDGSTDDKIDDCNPSGDDVPWIDLTFKEPQTILSVEFFDIENSEKANTGIQYWVTGGDTKTESLQDAKGGNVPSPLDLFGLTNPAPVNIEKIRLPSSRGDSFSF